MAKSKVFISYSHHDYETAMKLVDALTAENVTLWSDQQIRAGDKWESEILKALNEASVYVFLVSPDFVASDWAMYEIGHALARSKETGAPIVPVIIKNVIVPELLNRFHWIDAREISPKEFAEKIKHLVDVAHDRA